MKLSENLDCWLFLRGCCCRACQFCQAQSTAEQNPTLRTRSNVVLVPALVKDKAGKLVFGLQAKDFIIEDDGVEQQISMDEAEPHEAVSLVIAIQSGRSALFEFHRMQGLSSMLDQIVSQRRCKLQLLYLIAT